MCFNSNNRDNTSVSFPGVILVDNNNTNLNDDCVVWDMHDNDFDSGENEGVRNANLMALNNNSATSNDQNDFWCTMWHKRALTFFWC